MVWINVAIIAVPSIALFLLLTKRRPREIGRVSRQWIAQHAAD